MRSSILAFVVVVTALSSSGAFAQTCTVGQPETCNVEGLVEFCDEGTLGTFDCSTAAEGATCAPLNCVGTGCPADIVRCENVRGGPCIGIGTLFDGDTANDNLLNFSVCESGSVCLADDAGETCAAPPAGTPGTCTVADSGLSCRGAFLLGCIGFASTNVQATPGVLDCAAVGAGFTCVEADGQVGCQNPACGAEGNGRCDNGTAVSCEGGEIIGESDCLTLGQACIQDSPAATPFCATADPACGVDGLGTCAGSTATICAGGSVTTTTDCSTVARVCGAIDATGRIGCIIPGGEGEGEGEGEPECADDNDCDDDEVCDDGECESDRSDRGGEPVAPAPGLFSCAQSGPLVPGALALAALAIVLRRRRC
ncbi:MAG: hypothetical protein Q8O67_22900 [Deltaproteobacteria bacterium]|nr:hypothetical protein [Deltaproteobacteria bacterium]